MAVLDGQNLAHLALRRIGVNSTAAVPHKESDLSS